MKPLSKLFSPIRIGSMELKNRIVMAPMTTHLANKDGTATQKMIDYFEARAKGGVGLIILPTISVDRVSPFEGNLSLWSDKYIPGLREIVEAVHSHGAKIVPQFGHPGMRLPPVSDISLRDIPKIIEQFGDATRRAREAGCDGVELHSAHAFMILGSFISALCNRRTDEYGGSIEGRIKLLIEVVQSIHDREGRDFPVIVRISADELQPGGRTIQETQYIAPLLAEAGVDVLHLSAGIVGDWRIGGKMGTGSPRGVNVLYSRAVKEVVNIPVAIVGRINDPRLAEDILVRNLADLIVMGRALLADPELPKKATEGKFEDIAPCIGCLLGCSPPIVKLTCTVNPALCREKEMAITATPNPKKVMVIGGGPGGLEAATASALRGHKVTLYEKSVKLGGQFNLATVAPFKQELTRVIQYLTTQMKKAGVKVKLNTEVTPELIGKTKPDVVIVATGSKPLIPDIPGIKGKRIVTAHDVLAGKVKVKPGNVIVAGGGMVGCEVAELLANRGDNQPDLRLNVTIIEMLNDIALDVAGANRAVLLQQLREKDVRILTSAKIREFLEDGLVIVRDGREETIRGADSIILAMGARAVDGLSRKIKNKVAEVYVIGDAKEPRRALEAIAEGAEIGRNI